MTFEQLFHFAEIYRQKSITKAAENLYISRQALSLSVKKLEEEFGVTLFTRLANGVEPTKAGKEFYRSAHSVLTEVSVLRQNMLQYSSSKPILNICKVGVAESLMSIYGGPLLDTLSEVFPHTYFDFSVVVSKQTPDFYQIFDLSIVILSDQTLPRYLAIADEHYVVQHITTYPIYIWISATSPLNEYTTLNFEMLRNTPFCALRSAYSGTNFISYLQAYTNEMLDNHPTIELKKNLIDHIENFGYYTIDLPLHGGKLLYEELFQDRNITLKATTQSLYLEVIYHRDTCQDFYPIVADFLSNN